MKAVHLVCKWTDRPNRPNGLDLIDKVQKIYTSRAWAFTAPQAQSLVGGYIYLHRTKNSKSFIGGRILDFAVEFREDVSRHVRMTFTFKAEDGFKGQKWRGSNNKNDWTGGIIEVAD